MNRNCIEAGALHRGCHPQGGFTVCTQKNQPFVFRQARIWPQQASLRDMLTAAREPLIAIQQWPNINEACAFLAFSKSLRSGELRRFSIRKNKVKNPIRSFYSGDLWSCLPTVKSHASAFAR